MDSEIHIQQKPKLMPKTVEGSTYRNVQFLFSAITVCCKKFKVPETLHDLLGKSFLFHVTIDTVLPIPHMPCKYFTIKKLTLLKKNQLKNG